MKLTRLCPLTESIMMQLMMTLNQAFVETIRKRRMGRRAPAGEGEGEGRRRRRGGGVVVARAYEALRQTLV